MKALIAILGWLLIPFALVLAPVWSARRIARGWRRGCRQHPAPFRARILHP